MFRYKSLFFVFAILFGVLITPLHAGAQESKKPSGQVQAQPSDEAVWQRFLEWLPSASPGTTPYMQYNQYRSRLISAGTSDAEADRQIDIIMRMYHERPDAMRITFNKVYGNSAPSFVTQPNALLVATVEGHKPGRALDIGMGQGRNSVFLALKGWDVTGFDVSDEGIAAARKNAERAGVKINAVRETDEAFDYGSEQWDLIVFMYESFPVTSTAYVERLCKSMKPGGLIVIESHATDPRLAIQLPTAIDPSQLLAAFKGFQLLHFEDTLAKADWSQSQPGGKMRIVRMVAEKSP